MLELVHEYNSIICLQTLHGTELDYILSPSVIAIWQMNSSSMPKYDRG